MGNGSKPRKNCRASRRRHFDETREELHKGMKIGTMMITAGVVALGLAAWNTPSNAQGPMYDRVNVNLPYAVTVGNRTLQPGDYVIQQLRDQGGNSRVLLIYSDNGMKFETSAMTIPALERNTPESTKVVLHHFGNDYYFDKVWIQGKDYGYEFPVPDSVKSRERERMQPMTVAATYSSVPQSEATTTNTTTAATTRSTTTAATTQSTTTSAANNSATTARQTTPAATTTPSTTTAQSTPPAATTQATSPATTSRTMTAQNQTTTQPSTMAPATTASTARSTASSADRTMPNTSAGWLMMLLSGGALSGAGLSLRRKR
jgi:hypothetical protein